MKLPLLSLSLLATAAACTGGGDTPVPSATADDGAAPRANQLSARGERPCGYDYWRDHLDPGQTTPTKQVEWLGTITYDGGGRDIAEHAIDATTGAPVYGETTEYDAMGNFTKVADTDGSGVVTYSLWAAYDSFGHMVEYAGDQNGDGVQDWDATYAYGDDGRRTTAHLNMPSAVYDRAYHYGADGRLATLAIDYGPDGTIDHTQSFSYDDATHTQTRQTVTAAGDAIGHGSTSYTDDGRVLVAADVDNDPAHQGGYGYDLTETHTYDGETELSLVYDDKYIRPSDGEVWEDIDHWVWTFDHCQ